jgi:endonuclease YncB( thermonuclease family)
MLLRRFRGTGGALRWCRWCRRGPEPRDAEGEGEAGDIEQGRAAGVSGGLRAGGGGGSGGLRAGTACGAARLGPEVVAPSPAPKEAPTTTVPAALAAASLDRLRHAARHEDPTLRFGLYLRGAPCKVVKVYDGDSLTLVWEDPNRPSRLVFANCRLYGIDAPELRGGAGGDAEKAAARRCRDLLARAFLGELLEAESAGTTGLDKYGRPLVVLRARGGWTSDAARRRLGGGTLNDWILARLPGVVPYFGGRKGAPEAAAAAAAGGGVC